ncbi:MAG TPA: T9SS type A sorting domain-containing protein [Cyclobacteriaceae bacterium]|nr:T9SS type A sorting domain-containing protein [Cyclobacteriaceae bacterium]
MKLRVFLGTILFYWVSVAQAQNIKDVETIIRKIKSPTICYAGHQQSNFHLPPPEEFEVWKLRSNNREDNTSAVFEIEYEGFEGNDAAKNAFEYAFGIWSSLIDSEVPIRVLAIWTTLQPGALGGAFPTSVIANFDGAQKLNIFYPIALAEKMAGREFNSPNDPDIVILFSNSANWHYDTSTAPTGESFDLATVVLHEIGHGLGFYHTFSLVEGNMAEAEVGFNTTPIPVVFDTEVENANGLILLKNFPAPSAELKGQLTNNNAFYNSPLATSNNNNSKPKLYAPTTFAPGSSIAHLDEFTYNFTPNALMTPSIDFQERIHDPGQLTKDIFSDMGWVFSRIIHTPLPNTENVIDDFEVKVIIKADQNNGYDYLPDEIFLTYYIDFILASETTVQMLPTAEPNEFVATIPSTGDAAEYIYFISMKDNTGRTLTKPGKFFSYDADEDDQQFYFFFEAGPDNQPPVIGHQPLPFIRTAEEELTIEATVTDNIGIESVELEYQVNDGPITTSTLLLSTSNQYSITINLLALNLNDGDVLSYRIIATDNSSNQNVASLPDIGFFNLNVVGLAPVQSSYFNDFNSASNDFFGTNFSITQPGGFDDPAIHSDHPYLDGTGPNLESNYIYQLRVPIEIAAENATMTFDEIALIEPGEPNIPFGQVGFWDYVIVEGSKDGGASWIPLLNGYDARDQQAWLTRYNSGFDATELNSTGVGDKSLFRPRTLNLLDKFEPGDVVVFRFRLFADELAHGWGWAIDNLKIQIDETPPVIMHDHIDYLFPNQEQIALTFIVEDDPSGIESIQIEFKFNDDPEQVFDFPVIENINQYTFTIDLQTALANTDVFQYRIKATDGAENTRVFPSNGFLQAPVFVVNTPVSTYLNNFNAASNDFVGNYFSITTPSSFTNNAIHSVHPYPLGRGLNKTSNFTYTLKTPVSINPNNPFLVFDEIAIVEPGTGGSPFGSVNFRDYVVVEISKDAGNTWEPLIDGWDASVQSAWNLTFNQISAGFPQLFRTRFINMISTGKVAAAETVMFRFRLFSNETINGWGWAIDNIQIQGPITSVEDPAFAERALQLYPNPAKNQVQLKLEIPGYNGTAQVSMLDMMGRPKYSQALELNQGVSTTSISTENLPAGQYLIRVQAEKLSLTKKLMVIK